MSRNRLGETASPYLRQHADNPVHWWPWTAEAFAEAEARNVPVHLSIGYAACHWCHVMADESFSDPDVAAYLNDHFVNIKVDREERPDVDQIYMKALHALGEQGGWPLTMFTSPAGEPFWGGTYFPPEPRWGRPSFRQLLEGISAAWQNGEKRITDNMAALVDHLGKLPDSGTALPEPQMIGTAVSQILSIWDQDLGGIRGAPKFPMSPLLDLIWRESLSSADESARSAVLTTLKALCSGGIYDHLAGGFARYSVDDKWLVPHFEKMLSDNGQIISHLVRAWHSTSDPLFRQRAEETASWIITDMQLPDGGIAASLDADTDHEEGFTYVWTKSEIDDVLGADSAEFCNVYDVTTGGNWEGKTILNRLSYERNKGFDIAEEARFGALRERLLAVRRHRPQPGRDEKVLADWNAIAIAALAEAAVAFDQSSFLNAAENAFLFVSGSMVNGDQLAHSWCDGRITSHGLATDLAQMTGAAIALYSATGNGSYLKNAEHWFSQLQDNYIDSGVVFLSPADHNLIIRPSGTQDDATPSAAGIAVQSAIQLFSLTGKALYLESAELILKSQSDQISRDLVGSASLLAGFDAYSRPRLAYLAGEPGKARNALRQIVLSEADPSLLMLLDHTDGASLPHLVPDTGRNAGEPRLFLCEATSCRPPVSDPSAAAAILQESRPGGS